MPSKGPSGHVRRGYALPAGALPTARRAVQARQVGGGERWAKAAPGTDDLRRHACGVVVDCRRRVAKMAQLVAANLNASLGMRAEPAADDVSPRPSSSRRLAIWVEGRVEQPVCRMQSVNSALFTASTTGGLLAR